MDRRAQRGVARGRDGRRARLRRKGLSFGGARAAAQAPRRARPVERRRGQEMTALVRVEAFRRLPNGDPGLTAADAETFRGAMRQLASGVSLITHAGEGQPAGLTATSVTSLSIDPPAL